MSLVVGVAVFALMVKRRFPAALSWRRHRAAICLSRRRLRLRPDTHHPDRMIELDRILAERHPRWFSGTRGAWPRSVARSIGRFAHLDRAASFLDNHRHLTGFAFVEAALDFLRVRYTVDQVERDRIPRSGRLLIVANHPAGAHDALALLHLVGSLRRDVKIVGNDLLMRIESLRPLLLPLRTMGGNPGADSIEAIDKALADEQCVIVFPAGEVSRLHWRGIVDTRWRRGFLRFARNSGAPVLPVKIKARNSALFYGASALFKPLGTLLLPREIFARSGARLELRVGHPLQILPTQAPDAALAKVRQALYAIGTRGEAHAPTMQALVPAVERGALLAALRALPLLGHTADGKRIHAGRLDPDSLLLREIGRLRELSFRAVGEGTGRRLDVDAYDGWYEHIILWDPEALEIAGAYRVASGEQVLAERGVEGLYTASLFRYDCSALPRLAQGVELGRSFVAPAYWSSRSLDYLWIGVGAWLRQHPEVRYLFGSVSASAALPPSARDQLVAYYQNYFGADDRQARAVNPFQFDGATPEFGDLNAEESFCILKANLGRLGAKVPTLYKQYTELCEPGGVRFLAFGVDPDFANSVDGLIELDLRRIKPRKRERYLLAPGMPGRRLQPA